MSPSLSEVRLEGHTKSHTGEVSAGDAGAWCDGAMKPVCVCRTPQK